MRLMMRASILVGGLVLQACSTTPISSSEATPVPSERRFVEPVQGCDTCGTVALTRDAGFMGAACSVTAHFDGRKIAELKPGESVSFPAQPGQHVLEAEPGFCAGNRVGTTVLVESRRKFTYRIGRDHNGSIMLVPSY